MLSFSVAVLLVCLAAMPASAPVAAVTGATLASAPVAPGDEHWAAGFNLPGMNDDVYTLAFGPDGSLYTGGSFTTAGEVAANRIARWDDATSSWHPLGSGMAGAAYPYLGTSVHALAFGLDGSLYAGGRFDTAGGVAANNIARWDGSQWHPLGSGMNSRVSALAFGPDGSLYAGGRFTSAGGVAVNGITRWDGVRWHPLGKGVAGGGYPYPFDGPSVYALAFGADGSLFAGGVFTSAGWAVASFIARWDGATSSWHPLGSGMSGPVYALTHGPDGSLYAGGEFRTAGGLAANRIARWDGSQWHPLGSGMGGADYPMVMGLVFGPDGSLYAGGEFDIAGGVAANRVARWDGSQWHPLGSGIGGIVYALTFGPDGSLYAGGGVTANGIARWDGTSWHPRGSDMGSGMNYSVYALAFGPDGSLYAGGEFTLAGGVAANRIARWDGSQWHPLGSGMNYGVYALAVGPDGSLYAGGRFATAGGVAASRVARWDGSQWHPLSSGIIGDVEALAVGPDGSLYAGGRFYTAGGVAANGIARWDGTSWHSLGSGMGGGGSPCPYVSALAFGPDGSLYAGGCFTTAGGVAANGIARWDGSQWHPLGSGMSGWVSALALGPDGSLYAGGYFTTVGGVAANGIARWDGAQWHPLGSGMGGADYPMVRGLVFGPDGSLYAGGQFDIAGWVSANGIARWDGTSWHPLGSGMTGGWYQPYVLALAFGPDGSLYAGGQFDIAGGKPSSCIARWTGAVARTPVAWFPIALIDQ